MRLEIGESLQGKSPIVHIVLDKFGGDIRVKAVDEKGNAIYNGNLLIFRENGTVYRNLGVSDKLGFKLDSQGRIEIQNPDC